MMVIDEGGDCDYSSNLDGRHDDADMMMMMMMMIMSVMVMDTPMLMVNMMARIASADRENKASALIVARLSLRAILWPLLWEP